MRQEGCNKRMIPCAKECQDPNWLVLAARVQEMSGGYAPIPRRGVPPKLKKITAAELLKKFPGGYRIGLS